MSHLETLRKEREKALANLCGHMVPRVNCKLHDETTEESA